MSLELKSENDTETLLVPGSNGVFDVSVNGIVVFSKNKIGFKSVSYTHLTLPTILLV